MREGASPHRGWVLGGIGHDADCPVVAFLTSLFLIHTSFECYHIDSNNIHKDNLMTTYKELLVQRDALERQINDARQIEVKEAISQVKRLVTDYSLTASDCGFRSGGDVAPAGKVRAPVPVKYRGPDGQTWSGRGRAPNWLVALEAQGRNKGEFLV